MQVWSLEQSASAGTRSKHPMLQRANATWSVKERGATCVEEPTDCPSIGWSWARSRRAAVSLCLTQESQVMACVVGHDSYFPFLYLKLPLTQWQLEIGSSRRGPARICGYRWMLEIDIKIVRVNKNVPQQNKHKAAEDAVKSRKNKIK